MCECAICGKMRQRGKCGKVLSGDCVARAPSLRSQHNKGAESEGMDAIVVEVLITILDFLIDTGRALCPGDP